MVVNENEKSASGRIKIKTVGWPHGSHKHEINTDIPGKWVVLCDICPVCGKITENQYYDGDSKPTILGIYSEINSLVKISWRSSYNFWESTERSER